MKKEALLRWLKLDGERKPMKKGDAESLVFVGESEINNCRSIPSDIDLPILVLLLYGPKPLPNNESGLFTQSSSPKRVYLHCFYYGWF